jgi:membrane-bound serine protease (ClpP class)
MGEKAVNDVAAMARGFAELRGRSPEVAELIVTKSKSYTAEEALKVGLIDAIAESRGDLYQKLSEK